MDNKSSTDIDRKLAIYYHPLFQEIIKAIIDLFHISAEKFEIGLLEFVQFNLKLQKALLPSFEIDNALVSALNDWVKEVAECLTYQGMVSTTNCVEVTSSNLQQLILKEIDQSCIQLFAQKPKFMQHITKIMNHDAFKLLGVKINKEVFSKFMFDLCSTWCQFLDIQLFSYFLIAMYIQISKGDTIQNSSFKNTLVLETIDIDFMEQFEEVKNYYSRNRKKDLRYYRAWCQWNYLRVNDVGEKLILKLDEIHVDDNRILQLAMIFQRAIQVINEQITSQNPQKQKSKSTENRPPIQPANQNNQQFLILKKLNIESDKVHPKQSKQAHQNQTDYYENYYEQYLAAQQDDTTQQDFQIEIDEAGNMYLKRIVKLPVLGVKIQPENFSKKIDMRKKQLLKKNKEFREISNLYGRMEQLKIRLEHNIKNDFYTFKKNEKIKARDEFYAKREGSVKASEMDKTIHQKLHPKSEEEPQKQIKIVEEVPRIKKQIKSSIRENADYIHKVMAPSFLTDNQHNLSFNDKKQGNIYSTNANEQKRELKLGVAKIKNMDFRVKQLKSYHIVGKLTTDRNIINNKIKSESFSVHNIKEREAEKLEKMKQEHKYIWSRYIDEEEIQQLNNYDAFYQRLEGAKRKFGREFQSEYRSNLKPILAYENRRHEMGGILSKEDQERFSQRIKKLINKQNRRNKRKQKKSKMKKYRGQFKNKDQKKLFEDIFLGYHRGIIKSIKEQRKHYNSMIAK